MFLSLEFVASENGRRQASMHAARLTSSMIRENQIFLTPYRINELGLS
jgi:hypothetical protein